MIVERSTDSPAVISYPPLVFLAALVAGFFVNWLAPLVLHQPLYIAGGVISFAGVALGLWGIRAFHRAGTAVRPDCPVTALVTDGPFQYTRNPLYIGLTSIYAGIALSTGVIWLFATLVPALAVVNWKIVRREEQYLQAKFGDAYRAYKALVPRWV